MDPRTVLNIPAFYRALQSVVGGEASWRSYISNVVKLNGGERVLDLGCGPGHIVPWLPEVDYYGVDIDENYIAEANERFGYRAHFYCRALSDDAVQDLGQFDVVIATGVLHHLDDDTARSLFRCASYALKPGGRLVTCDGVKGERMSPVARLLIQLDRGQFVRSREAYENLARAHFTNVTLSIRDDLSRVPYKHCIMECAKSIAGAA